MEVQSMNFIGRKRELATLDRLYQQDKFQFVVIYGRRRVGKTALINKFIENKPAIYFTGVESNSKQNLENLSSAIYDGGETEGLSFASFQMALENVFKTASTDRKILVLDEYPYVAKADKSFASTLQMLIDKYKDTSKLYLILCGSSMSYMEDEVLAYKAPLYGRRTAQMKILPFTFQEVCEYATGFSPIDKALLYGIAGGTPQYLLQMDNTKTIEDNIKDTFLNPSSILFEEPMNLLKQEVREPSVYTAVITAIATGASKISEISNKIGEDTSICSNYIRNLINLGIVRKETPYGEKPGKKTIYIIEDNMFKFWYRFIPKVNTLIARGRIDSAYAKIEPHLTEYMGHIFEDICTEYLWHLLDSEKSSVEFSGLGHWWGNDPKEKKQVEIDILGFGEENDAIFAECKWQNEKVDTAILKTLVYRSTLFHKNKKFLYLFSKSGFTTGCIKEANELGNVKLISYEEIVK